MCHGFAGTKSERKFVELARALAQENIASLRFDFSGCGDSEGSLENMSIEKQTREVWVACLFLENYRRIGDNRKIGLFGYSLGAINVCQSANMGYCNIVTLVLAAPALNQKELIKTWYSERERKKWKEQGYLDTSRGRIGTSYLTEASTDYSHVLDDNNLTVLIFHGLQDEDVPIEFSEQLVSRKRAMRELIKIQGADHRLESHGTKKILINHSVEWFKKHLGAE